MGLSSLSWPGCWSPPRWSRCDGDRIRGPTRKVQVESDPPGATVYLNDPSEGELCKTPCTIDAPIGETPIILQLENYEPLFEHARRPAQRQDASRQLHAAERGRHARRPRPRRRDDQRRRERQGQGPRQGRGRERLAPRHVMFKGTTLFDDFINVETGSDTEIMATASSAGAPRPARRRRRRRQRQRTRPKKCTSRRRAAPASASSTPASRPTSGSAGSRLRRPARHLGLNSGRPRTATSSPGPRSIWPAELLKLGAPARPLAVRALRVRRQPPGADDPTAYMADGARGRLDRVEQPRGEPPPALGLADTVAIVIERRLRARRLRLRHRRTEVDRARRP